MERLTTEEKTRLITAAKLAKPTPCQSGYQVYCGLLTERGRIITGSNHEYGITRSIHGEETAIARWLEECPEDPIRAMAFPRGGSSCGNCRDVEREYCSPEMWFVDDDGGEYQLKDLLFDSFQPHAITHIPFFRDAMIAEFGGSNSPERAYGVALVNQTVLAKGSFRDDDAYHPHLPIAQALNNYLSSRQELPNAAVIAHKNSCPDVPYLERQHLYQFNAAIKEITGKSLDVYLFSHDGNTPSHAWKTDAEEWIPNTFTLDNGYSDLVKKLKKGL